MPPLKSISVTPSRRAGNRKQASPAVADAPEDSFALQAALARPPRRVAQQPAHCYRVGEHLRMTGGGQSVQRAASGCKVVFLLPYEGRGALLYRVRSDSESFERIVSEADLAR